MSLVKRTAYLCTACDADPDSNPPFRQLPAGGDPKSLWQGILVGIPNLRRRLQQTPLPPEYGSLPITWLIRADRQIHELFGDAAFCLRQFYDLWKTERELGSELGWHPHLYRWHEPARNWTAYLGQDDDLEMLTSCLAALRQLADIRAVRTGWDYLSNRLLGFLEDAGLTVDASAIPGSLQAGSWAHDWRGTPRAPYLPSQLDYRRPALAREQSRRIVEMPVLVRRLPGPLRLARHGLRCLRGLGSAAGLPDWQSARWQGMLIAVHRTAFGAAARQTLAESARGDTVFLTTYFHAGDLLSPAAVETLLENLHTLSSLAKESGYALVPTTLTAAAVLARPSLVPAYSA